MSKQTVEVIKVTIQAVLALTLLIGMIWIVLSQNTSDTASKSALVILGSAAGFIFGRYTSAE